MEKVKEVTAVYKAMGWRYTGFRIRHELEKRAGLLQKKYPLQYKHKKFISKNEWQNQNAKFFFTSRNGLNIPKEKNEQLKQNAENILHGIIPFFYGEKIQVTEKYNWVTNPENNYSYLPLQHWTKIPEFIPEAGDIKYVWEPSRFCFLYEVIRYDYHFEKDCSQFIFGKIISWIDSNPLNLGPNYISGQEIALRILNWIFFLHYYKYSDSLTENILDKILNSVYRQLKHVEAHLSFSKSAVRNNHILTESAALYIGGILFPFFKEAESWRKKGKSNFEHEINFQIADDGSYIQYSFNYQRIVVQLLTWVLHIGELNNDVFSSTTLYKTKLCCEFLSAFANAKSGYLPNYGANDGSLFFPLNNTHFRNYAPQLQSLAAVLQIPSFSQNIFEELYWYNLQHSKNKIELKSAIPVKSFNTGGYYTITDKDTFTFIRCGNHASRPSQADNLHVDIWYKSENILRDCGSYLYNTDEKTVKYFSGTASHNTVMLNTMDQMEKGVRFLWRHWSQCQFAELEEKAEHFEFTGIIKAFKQSGKWICHKRTIKKYKNNLKWHIEDEILSKKEFLMHQIWNVSSWAQKHILFESTDETGKHLTQQETAAYYSSTYGVKENSEQIIFSTQNKKIFTSIQIAEN